MSDLSDKQAGLTVKLAGADPNTGVEDNFAEVDSNGRLQALVFQGTSPWVVSATQSGTWTTGRTWTLASGTDSVSCVQSTSPWVVSATSWPLPTGAATEATLSALNTKFNSNYGVATGAIRVAAQLGNASAVADFNSGVFSAQTLRVVIATNQPAVPVSGTFWQATQPVSGTFWQAIQPVSGTVAVTQSTSPWVVSAASLPLPTGAATETTLSSLNNKFTLDFGVSTAAVRVAALLGNASGVAAFGAGTTNAQTLRVVIPTDQTAIPVTGTFWQTTQPVSGTVTANQGTSPWVVSGTVAATQSGTWSTGRTWSLASGIDSVSAVQSGTWNIGTLTSITNPVAVTGTFWQAIQPVSGTVTANQGTSPWVVSGTLTAAEDKNYGTVGATTLRTAAQIGNALGAADFAAGNSSAQTLRVVVASNQVAIPVTGTFWQATQPVSGTVAVTQSTSPWVVSGAVTANQGTSPWVVSAASLPLPAGAATEATLSALNTKFTLDFGASTAAVRVAALLGNATGQAAFGAGVTNAQTLRVVLPTDQTAIPVTGTFWPTTQPVSGTVAVTQSTSPWVVSGTVALSEDHNYGTVGATTLRVAAQIGNAGGAADYNAGATGAQTLRTQANQGAANTLANAWPTKITDGTNAAAVSTNHDVSVSDGLHGSGLYGNLALTTANTAYEVKVGASRLTGRKSVTIMPVDADMYWGYNSSVTTSNGTPIFRNQFMEFSIDANDSTAQIWVVCASASKNARITESP